jgi:hypothetical protein
MSNEQINIKSLENLDVTSITSLINGANIRKRTGEMKRKHHNHIKKQISFCRLMGLLPNSHLKMEILV